jgi:ketosteroid isomerase-like protein
MTTPAPSAAEANARMVREFYAALAAGDIDAAGAHLADDAVLHVPGRSPNTGDYEGPAAVLGFIGHAFEVTGGTLQLRLERVLADEEVAVALATYTASRPDGRPDLLNNVAHIARISGGRIGESWLHSRDQYAVDAFWGD